MARPPFPKNLHEFRRQFATEEACEEYLVACRWPGGFVCPRCGHRRAYPVAKRRWQCAECRHQVSLTAGTILHNTKTPLTQWFWAAYLRYYFGANQHLRGDVMASFSCAAYNFSTIGCDHRGRFDSLEAICGDVLLAIMVAGFSNRTKY